MIRKKSITISLIHRQTREERDDSLGAGKQGRGRVVPASQHALGGVVPTCRAACDYVPE
jgi:hypothetical protein